MELNYQELIAKSSDREFVKMVACCDDQTLKSLEKWTKEEVLSLLHHHVWGSILVMLFLSNISIFKNIFEKDSLEVLKSLNSRELLEEFLSFTILSCDEYNEEAIILLEDCSFQNWLVGNDLLQKLLYYNASFQKKITNGISQQTLRDNFKTIFLSIAKDFHLEFKNLMEEVKKDPVLYQMVEENYETYFHLFEQWQGPSLISFLNNTGFIKKRNLLIEENKDYIIQLLFSSDVFIFYDNPYFESLKLLLLEILHIENATIKDIEYLASGSYNDVYRIKDFVLKIGCPRNNYEIPTHKFILKPLFRKYLEEIGIMIEVARYVEPVHDEEISKKLFFSLMDDDIVWLDPKSENIGRVIPYQHTDMSKLPQFIANESLGFIGENQEEIESGSYVILDTDFLRNKEQFDSQDCFQIVHQYLEEYEQRGRIK